LRFDDPKKQFAYPVSLLKLECTKCEC
jgi:hypothetical protein